MDKKGGLVLSVIILVVVFVAGAFIGGSYIASSDNPLLAPKGPSLRSDTGDTRGGGNITHLECGNNNTCVEVPGNGTNECDFIGQFCGGNESWLVFVTDLEMTGILGNTSEEALANADSICNQEASEKGIDGTYAAWLSSSIVNAKDRIEDGKYINIYGETIADDKTDLLDGTLDNGIDPHVPGPNGKKAWTGTNTAGTVINGFHCNDWTGEIHTARSGLSKRTNQQWTDSSSYSCYIDEPFYLHNLYCFQISGDSSGSETHAGCITDDICVEVFGSGADECNTNADCLGNQTLPDLRQLNVAVSDANVTVNTTITVWNTIENIGNVSTGLFTTKIEDLTANFTIGSFVISLGPQEVHQFVMNYTVQGPQGTFHTIQSFVDSNEEVEESNENNNIGQFTELFVA